MQVFEQRIDLVRDFDMIVSSLEHVQHFFYRPFLTILFRVFCYKVLGFFLALFVFLKHRLNRRLKRTFSR